MEICVDYQEVLCNTSIKECCVCENVTKCRDYLMVGINDFEEVGFVWKCDECKYYAAQYYGQSEERGEGQS